MVSSVGSSTTATTTDKQSTADKAITKFGNDYNDFLKLLVTQLKNQDPTAPLDANQFTTQLVQFTQAEQSVATNKNLETLIDQNNVVKNTNMVSYVGLDAEVEGNFISLGSEGGTNFAYNLDSVPDNVFVTVRDAKSGDAIFTASGTKNVGRNTVSWDGKDANGDRVKAGTYQIEVSTADKSGANLKSLATYVSGKVQGVNLNDENPSLIINNEKISLDKVRFIGLQS